MQAADAPAFIDTLIAAGADIEAQDDSEPCGPMACALHVAAEKGNYEAALSLLQHGADMRTIFAPSGGCALHFACKFLSEDVVKLLLKWGADVTAINRYDARASDCVPEVARIRAGEDAQARLAKRERILALLSRERAWRSRRFWIICRAHPERLSLACCGEGGKDTCAGDDRAGSSSNKLAREEPPAAGEGGEEDCNAVRSFDRLAAWLMEIQEEGLFRHVVKFL